MITKVTGHNPQEAKAKEAKTNTDKSPNIQTLQFATRGTTYIKRYPIEF